MYTPIECTTIVVLTNNAHIRNVLVNHLGYTQTGIDDSYHTLEISQIDVELPVLAEVAKDLGIIMPSNLSLRDTQRFYAKVIIESFNVGNLHAYAI